MTTGSLQARLPGVGVSQPQYDFETKYPDHIDPREVSSREKGGLEIVGYQRELPHELEMKINMLAWVVGGDLTGYIRRHFEREKELPRSYTALHNGDWDPYVARVSGSVYRYGYGIGRKLMEGSLRVLTGGGRFDRSNITLLGCGTKPFVLAGDAGVLLGSIRLCGRPSDTSTLPRHTVATDEQEIKTVEGSQSILHGIERVLEYADILVGSQVEYESRGPQGVWLVDGSGEKIQVQYDVLSKVGRSLSDPDAVVRDGQAYLLPNKPWQGDGTTVAWTPQNAVGELDQHGHLCIGYRIHWSDPPSHVPESELPAVSELRLGYNDPDEMASRLKLFESIDWMP